MKKIVMALAAMVMAGSAFAADVVFYNKLFEEGVLWEKEGDDSETKFPGITDKMHVEYKSEHVDASITTIIGVEKDYEDGTKDFYLDGYIDDWYMEWRLIQALTIGLHDNIYSDASVLAIVDDEMEGGNIGSDGFTAIYRPEMFNRALRLAVTLPLEFTKDGFDASKANWLKGKDLRSGDTRYVNFGIGAIYTGSAFQVGFTAKNLLNEDLRFIGFTLNFPNIVDGLTIGAGFTNTKSKEALCEDMHVTGENIINAQLAYETGAFRFDAETVIGLDKEELFDKYFGVMVGYEATEALALGAKFQMFMYGKDNGIGLDKNAWLAGVTLDYTIDEHNSVGIEFDYAEGGSKDYAVKQIKVPVYWKWSL